MSTSTNCFADVPETPRGHLGLLFYRATHQLISYLAGRANAAGKSLETVFEEFSFLNDYWQELRERLGHSGGENLASIRSECENWEAATTEWLPLRGLKQEAGLSEEALICLVSIGLVEEDARFAALFGTLQPGGHRRPTLGLLQALMQAGETATQIDAWNLCRPMLDSGLLEVMNRDAPRSEWLLRVPPPLWTALRGEASSEPVPGTRYHTPQNFVPVGELILPEHQINRLSELGTLLQSGRTRTLIMRGMPGNERLETVGSVARSLGRGLLELELSGSRDEGRWRHLGPLCCLMRALPVLCIDLGPGETFELPALSLHHGPIAVVMGREGGLTGPGAERCVTVNLETENAECRLQHWRRALQGVSVADIEQIASRVTLSARYIRQAAQLAQACASLERRTTVTAADVRLASRTISRERLDSLATRLEDGGNWPHLVVAPSTEAELHSLEHRCRYREQLATMLGEGMPGGLNRGVRALFEGPSGTGKTLAARILANELSMDVYRVDLAAIVNKYIGETEKNLSRVLSRAEDLDVILLLDEGDALMTRRTDVKSAHDRYANLETNYLLQRLETYTGIVIVTTNVGKHIDSAFRRRIDVVVKFHLPDPEERWRLWQLHLPAEHAVESAALEQVALRFSMTGGQIRNAAVHATLLAASAPRKLVTGEDLSKAIKVEYRKAGAAVPSGPGASPTGSDGRLTQFLAAIS